MINKELEKEFAFHNTAKDKPYFEGWYYKVQAKDITLAIIVGIHYVEGKMEAFIQSVDTVRKLSTYETFQEDEIHMSKEPFHLVLGDNVISIDRLILYDRKNGLETNLHFDMLTPIHQNKYMPTIMGPFSYLPMECIHSVISLHHQTYGSILLHNKLYDGKGIGYMEKDRGTSFPNEYIWFQSNQSEKGKSSFFLSIASIPLHPITFQGCIGILMVNGKQHRFATYLGCHISKLECVYKEGHHHVYIKIRQGFYTLDVHILQQDSYPLQAPKNGMMGLKIEESINSKAKVVLYHHDKVVENLIFERAGCEIKGYSSKSIKK